MNFPKVERRYSKAVEALRVVLDETFPIGKKVIVQSGHGFSHGTIAALSHASQGTLVIRNDRTGRVHHKHFHDVGLD